MTEKTEEKKAPKRQPKKFGKAAFLNAAQKANERMLLEVLLVDGHSYTKQEVQKIVRDWKQKEVKA